MDLGLGGKTALVTGASQGIGRAIAKALAAEGVKVCIAARRSAELEQLASEIAAAGGQRPHIVIVDILEKGAPQKLLQEALKALGQIDILVNSAGAGGVRLPIDTPDDHWEDMMTLNYVRIRQLTHAILPGMIANHWGRIINISGKNEVDGLLAAAPAKAAIHVWSKGLSREVGKSGITVNCIAPGRIMSEQIRRKYSAEYRAEHAARDIPVGRYGEPEELATLAVYLASSAASYITGTVIPVDGGLRRYAF